jgi:hypothetical protein
MYKVQKIDRSSVCYFTYDIALDVLSLHTQIHRYKYNHISDIALHAVITHFPFV